jgi:hypothetical protein
MAGERSDGDAPPRGEEIHLPDPSYLPVIVAAGVTLAVVGIVINFAIAGIGLVITILAVVRWVRQTREEMAELPLEHEH